jgi:hypothetical protein
MEGDYKKAASQKKWAVREWLRYPRWRIGPWETMRRHAFIAIGYENFTAC